MKTSFLQGRALWKTIASTAAAGRPRWIASPYVGKGAADLLPLQRGDVLLCSLTLENCRAGSVVPSELRALRRRGVRVYTRGDLHAKVFLLGRRAIVGSANLSANSRDVLDETGVVVSERREVASIRDWFAMRLVEPVEREWLSVCEKAYRAAETRRRRRAGRRQHREVRELAGPWVISTVPDWSEDDIEERYRDVVRAQGRARLARPRAHAIETLKWTGASPFRKNARVGDVVVEFHKDGLKKTVKPHARIVARREGRTARGTSATYFAMEYPKDYRPVPRARLEGELRRLGLRLRRRGGRVVEKDLAFALLRITSPERRR
jgi:hypothetical protein